MKLNLEKLNQLGAKASEEARLRANERRENRQWLKKSAQIALELHRHLRTNGIKQNQLADMLGVTPAQVTKLLSGKENLGLKTICKMEEVLGIDLIQISTSRNSFSSKVETAFSIDVPEKVEIPDTFIQSSVQTGCKIVPMYKQFTMPFENKKTMCM